MPAAQADIIQTPGPPLVSLEDIAAVRANLEQAGFFDAPPFTLTMKSMEKLVPGTAQDLMHRINLAEHTDEALQRLHVIPGPVLSAVIARLFDTSACGLMIRFTAPPALRGKLTRALELGLPMICRMARATPITITSILSTLCCCATCSVSGPPSALRPHQARWLAVCWCWLPLSVTGTIPARATGSTANTTCFTCKIVRSNFSRPHTGDLSKELRQSLEILVRTTDPRDAYSFSRAAYAFHVGLGAQADIPRCESLARLLGDPALCTLAARLNDVLYIPFVGLGSAYSARSMVKLGREIGQVIDFNFVRKHLITPMLSRPLYPGEHPHPALLVSRTESPASPRLKRRPSSTRPCKPCWWRSRAKSEANQVIRDPQNAYAANGKSMSSYKRLQNISPISSTDIRAIHRGGLDSGLGEQLHRP